MLAERVGSSTRRVGLPVYADVVLANPLVERIEEMSSANQLAILAFAVTFSSAAFAQASVELVVGSEGQRVQTPAQSQSGGISYEQTGAATSTLNVYTQGFLFCGNVSADNIVDSPVKFTLSHEDQSFTPAHPWMFNYGTDVLSFSYGGSRLVVNTAADTTLFCRGTDALGQVSSGSSEGIFDDGLDSATERNYKHLVNWFPPQRFSWETPDWSLVPTDGCDTLAGAQLDEDVACAAVSGVRPSPTVRAGTMWTATDGVNFTYLFRLDGRAGPQTPARQVIFQVPQKIDDVSEVDPAHPAFAIVDAFEGGDSGSVGYLSGGQADVGQWCFLTELPTTLTSTVCNGHQPTDLHGKPLSQKITMGTTPVGSGVTQSFYVAVTRPVAGGHPNASTPVVGAAVIVDPAIVAVGGDLFRGDDVVYGFLPSSTGFPWMVGQ